MDLDEMTASVVEDAGLSNATLDVVSIGKASREMSRAIDRVVGPMVRRRVIVCDEPGPDMIAPPTSEVVVGDHPVPGEGSLRAGRAVLRFLDQPSEADATLFLISGGASSLCVVPAAPLSLADLRAVWDEALRTGADITTLNHVRAASSLLSGGAVLRHVGTDRSASFILVDNVVSGAEWVASAMTYDFRPSEEEVSDLWARMGVNDPRLLARLREGFHEREVAMEHSVRTRHENRVLAEPAMMLTHGVVEASRRGYQVIDTGARISGDAFDVASEWSRAIDKAPTGPVALIGVGEVTVKVGGSGRGGRAQELAWLMASVLAQSGREGVFVAQASDGRDHEEGVGGAWVDETTTARARALGIDWNHVVDSHDTFTAHLALGQLIEGGHTGWNLCDLYVVVLT